MKHKWAWLVIICALAAIATIPFVIREVQYRTALKPVDIQARNYVSMIPGGYYSVSPEISPAIFGKGLQKTYREGAFPYIKRSKPMASTAWWGNRPAPNVPLYGAVKFEGDGVTIYVVLQPIENPIARTWRD